MRNVVNGICALPVWTDKVPFPMLWCGEMGLTCTSTCTFLWNQEKAPSLVLPARSAKMKVINVNREVKVDLMLETTHLDIECYAFFFAVNVFHTCFVYICRIRFVMQDFSWRPFLPHSFVVCKLLYLFSSLGIPCYTLIIKSSTEHSKWGQNNLHQLAKQYSFFQGPF